MDNKDLQLHESLRPTRANKIMDLVEQVGIDVSAWGVKKGGLQVTNPAANPNYCYEWAFGGNGEPTALCVWHRSLTVSNQTVTFKDNLRNLAIELERKVETKDQKIRSRIHTQAKRAIKFDLMLQHAFRKSEPVRLILLEGNKRSDDDLGLDASKVNFRFLDSEPWYIHEYGNDGAFSLVRSIPLQSTNLKPETSAQATDFVDQFSIPDFLKKRDSTSSIYIRNPQVRQNALKRAAGVCEFCNQLGFKMENGAIFLESHHIIPLSENGPDIEWNIIAICPNDHRRAHYGENQEEFRHQLQIKLQQYYPNLFDLLTNYLDTFIGNH